MFVALLLGLLLKGFVAKTIVCTYVYSINPSLYNVPGGQGVEKVNFWEKTTAAYIYYPP